MSISPIKIRSDVDAISRISIVPNILEVICQTTGMGFAAIARVTEDKWIACAVRDEIQFGLEPGGELQIATTLCNEIRQSGEAVIIDHVDEDDMFASHHTPAMYGFQSYISIPIRLKSGEFFGTLCAIDPKPAVLNTPRVIGMFTLFADLISFHLNSIEQLSVTEAWLQEEQRHAETLESLNKRLIQSNRELEAANNELAEIQQSHVSVVNKLKESEEKLVQAIQAGKMGTWIVDQTTFQVTMSDYIKELFGFRLGKPVSIEEILQTIDPEYLQPLKTTLSNAVRNNLPCDIEYPITNRITNAHKWVKVTGKAYFDVDGNPVEYSGIMTDITERKLDDLRKNDFIGMVSHELKTPLTSLNAYSQMLHVKAQKNQDSFTVGALDKVMSQIKKMSSIINGFLNVSRLESGKIQLHKQEFLLNKLVKEMIEEISLTAAKHRFALTISDSFMIEADRDKIGSVISNLLSNAVKYSPKGNFIEIKCTLTNGQALVSVKDEGMGIKKEDTERLFDRFYRVDNKNTRNISGFGIGLYLSAEIVHRHNGRIWVESELGKGSTFYFNMPLK